MSNAGSHLGNLIPLSECFREICHGFASEDAEDFVIRKRLVLYDFKKMKRSKKPNRMELLLQISLSNSFTFACLRLLELAADYTMILL